MLTPADRFTDALDLRARPLRQPPERPVDPALADREPEHLPTGPHQPLVPDVVALVEVPQQRLDVRPERPGRLQAGRVGALRPRPAPPTTRRVLPALDHHRADRRQLDDLAPPDPPLPGQGQRLTTSSTG